MGKESGRVHFPHRELKFIKPGFYRGGRYENSSTNEYDVGTRIANVRTKRGVIGRDART